ncbi:MAG: hypothetical protein HZC28_17375 [Spirochaetes bacterium]|nr:hypothetical protein [Spirochaetota bacterium]
MRTCRFNAITVTVLALVSALSVLNAAEKAPAASSANEIKIMQKSAAEVFVPIINPLHDSSLSNYLRAPKLRNLLGVELNSGEMKFVSYWNADVILLQENISNAVSVTAGENYISWNPRFGRIAAGNQVFAWGKADGMNPTAILNPMDYRIPVDLKKIPALSLSYTAYPAPWMSLDAVYLPFKQESMLPYVIADRIPRSVFNKYTATSFSMNITNFNMGTGAMGLTTAAAVQETVMTNDIHKEQTELYLERPVGALRMNFFFGPVDFSVMYAYDIDQFYTTAITLEKYTALSSALVDPAVDAAVSNAEFHGVIPSVLTNMAALALKASIPQSVYRIAAIELERKRIHRIGLDLKTSAGPFGLWGETCFSIGEDPKRTISRIRNPQLDWTAGLDVSYGPDDQWYLNVQYTGTYVLNYDSRFYADYANGMPDSNQSGNASYMEEYYYRAFTQKFGNQFEGLTHGFILRANWPLMQETLIPSLTLSYFLPAYYDTAEKTRYGRAMVMPEITWKISDACSASIGAALYAAVVKKDGSNKLSIDRDDVIGMFYDDSSVFFRFTYAWNMTRPLSE